MSVKAVQVDDIDAEGVPAGAYELEQGGMWYRCPCGCRCQGYLAFRPAPSPSWEWDGKMVSLHPSVNHVGHWHGWLKNGEWTKA